MSQSDIAWTRQMVLNLVKEYRQRPELWNKLHESYRVHTTKYESWRRMAAVFNCDIGDVRKKLNSVLASYRREKARVRAGGRSLWFLYKPLSFLPTHLDDSENVPRVLHSRSSTNESPSAYEDYALEEDGDTDQIEDEEIEQNIHEGVMVKSEPAQSPSPTFINQMSEDEHEETPMLAEVDVQAARPVRRRRLRLRAPALAPRRRVVPVALTAAAHAPAPAPAPANGHAYAQLDQRLTETMKLLRRSELSRRKDECDSFGEYIAVSLRKHDERSRSMIKQAINNILFEQEMKKYNSQYTVLITGDENPLVLEGESKGLGHQPK